MLAAPTLSDVLKRAHLGGLTRPLQDRLASIVFAHPASAVIGELTSNRALFDEQTGDAWDLFIAGYYQYGSHGDAHPKRLYQRERDHTPWMFSPRMFTKLVSDVEASSHGWRYPGDPQVVSFMVYGGEPDWLSLRSVDILGNAAPSMGRVVEGLRRWQDEEPDRRFAPGEAISNTAFLRRDALRDALRWAALAASAGVIGNRADAILERLFS